MPTDPSRSAAARGATRLPTDRQADPLANPALLAQMSPSLVALARRGERRRFERGASLIIEGDVSDSIFIVLRGRVQAYSIAADSGREFVFNTYGPGEYVGEMSLDGGPRSASVKAIEPSLCAMVTRPVLEAHLESDPQFAFELLAKVIRRARTATVTARQLAFNDVYGRLKALLESLVVEQPDGRWLVAERLTHQEMANRCGCTREMITRLWHHLQQHYVRVNGEGLVELLVRPLPAKF